MSVFSKLVAVAAWIALSVTTSAQGPSPEAAQWQATFDKGIAALQSGRHDEGIAAFQSCLEITPQNATCAYNIACGHSLKGEIDQAFAWLDKAADWGFGDSDTNIEHASKKDTDLEKLRSDPRFAEFVAKMTTRKKKFEEYYAKAAVYVPSALEGKAEVPLLVVLHDAGQTKDNVIEGPWKKVADELGMALVAPSGKYPTAGDPANGMRWMDDPQQYLARSWTYEKTAQDAVSAFQKERKVDRSRVVIAGEGEGGMLACSIGIGSPGLYKAVLAVNSSIPTPVVESKGANAGKMGLKMRLLLEESAAPELTTVVDAMRQVMSTWSIAGEVNTFVRGEPDAFTALLVENVRALLPAVQPVEATTTK